MTAIIALAFLIGTYPLIKIAEGDFGSGAKVSLFWQSIGPSFSTSLEDLRQEIVKRNIRIIVKCDGVLTSLGYISDLRFPIRSIALSWQHPRRKDEKRLTVLISDADAHSWMVHAMNGELQVTRLETCFFADLNSWLLSTPESQAQKSHP